VRRESFGYSKGRFASISSIPRDLDNATKNSLSSASICNTLIKIILSDAQCSSLVTAILNDIKN
jgi:hypothetical protein